MSRRYCGKAAKTNTGNVVAEHAETLIQKCTKAVTVFGGRLAAATGSPNPAVGNYNHGNISIHNINNFGTVASCCGGSDTNF